MARRTAATPLSAEQGGETVVSAERSKLPRKRWVAWRLRDDDGGDGPRCWWACREASGATLDAPAAAAMSTAKSRSPVVAS
jgi:hypothetical protein